MSAPVSKFIRKILTDGTYEQEIIRIGKEDPGLDQGVAAATDTPSMRASIPVLNR
jgi:hypothetical protein